MGRKHWTQQEAVKVGAALLLTVATVLGWMSRNPEGTSSTSEEKALAQSVDTTAASVADSIDTLLSDPDYFWPTDASTNITSSFGEFRNRHFHGGLDVSTWGRVGFKVFALRSGWVSRIRVSPFGYGKTLYLRLDTGETVLYAHLLQFNERLETLVQKEQARTGRYRVDKFFRPGEFPVNKGDVVAYTGQSGAGPPHLHFEISDGERHLTNPLLKGYRVMDKAAPLIRQVSVTPIDADSQVDGDFVPRVYPARLKGSGLYIVPQTITVWGRIGLGVSCDDITVGGRHVGVYKLELYIDDQLFFSTTYDRFLAEHTRMIHLDHDYRLMRRTRADFYNLYRKRTNQLTFYSPVGEEAGVLRSRQPERRLMAQTLLDFVGLPEWTQAGNQSIERYPRETSAFSSGLHSFRIVASDFFGNSATVTGTLLFAQKKALPEPPFVASTDGTVPLGAGKTSWDFERVEVFSSANLGRTWTKLTGLSTAEGMRSVPPVLLSYFQGGDPTPRGSLGRSLTVLKLVGYDQFGVPSYPLFRFVGTNSYPPRGRVTVQLQTDFYDDYMRVELHSSAPLLRPPKLKVGQDTVSTNPVDLTFYLAAVKLPPEIHGSLPVDILYEDLDGTSYVQREEVKIRSIEEGQRDVLTSEDGKCWVSFDEVSLYERLYGRIGILPPPGGDARFASNIYQVEPQDVPLNYSVRVSIQYPSDDPTPEKLGVYYERGRNWWVFLDNQLNREERMVSAPALSLENFALLRDTEPPSILGIIPHNGSRLRTPWPLIRVYVRDYLSGIGSEENIRLTLDGAKLIAEYDPELASVSYQPRTPLSRGRHGLKVWVKDRCGNVAEAESVFWTQ